MLRIIFFTAVFAPLAAAEDVVKYGDVSDDFVGLGFGFADYDDMYKEENVCMAALQACDESNYFPPIGFFEREDYNEKNGIDVAERSEEQQACVEAAGVKQSCCTGHCSYFANTQRKKELANELDHYRVVGDGFVQNCYKYFGCCLDADNMLVNGGVSGGSCDGSVGDETTDNTNTNSNDNSNEPTGSCASPNAASCLTTCSVCFAPFGADLKTLAAGVVAEMITNPATALPIFFQRNQAIIGAVQQLTDGNGASCASGGQSGCLMSCLPSAALGVFDDCNADGSNKGVGDVTTDNTNSVVAVVVEDVVTMVLKITLADGLDLATLSKEDFDTVKEKYQASAAAAAGIDVDMIERVEFYIDGKLIDTPTDEAGSPPGYEGERRDRRAEGEVTMKIVFKEDYTEADAEKAAATFNDAVEAGTVEKVTVTLADGTSYETTFESVEVVVEIKGMPGSSSSITGGVAAVLAAAATAAALFY